MLSTQDLFYQVIASLQVVNRDIALIEESNPFILVVGEAEYAFLVKNIGDAHRANADECRIQVGDSHELRTRSVEHQLLFLGYDEATDTFTAWDPKIQSRRVGPERSTQNVSLYSRWSILKEAHLRGAASYTDNDQQHVISFRSEFLPMYLQNFSALHADTDAAELMRALDIVASESDAETVEVEKRKVTVTMTRTGYQRDPRFRRHVLEADGEACVVCGMQMGLLEAAHIVPHSHPMAPDGPQNGMCMCPLHHAAFDAGILVLEDDFRFALSSDRVNYFEARGSCGGIDLLREAEGVQFGRKRYMPTVEIVRLARSARGL